MDLDRIKRNVSKMVAMNAPESEIDQYISSEGATVDMVRNYTPASSRLGVESQPQEPTVVQRGAILPIAEMSDGSVELAWPEPLKQAGDYAYNALTDSRVTEDFNKSWKRDDYAEMAAQHGANNALSMLPINRFPTIPRPRPINPVGTPTGRQLAENRLQSTIDDSAAFEAQGVRPYGPAFNQGPIASVGKQLTETPLVGAPLRNNMDETFADTAGAVTRLADDIAPTATAENAGLNVQRGLDRFRDRSFDELEPGVIRSLGIDPNSPVQAQQGAGIEQRQRIERFRPLVEQITGGATQTSRGANMRLPMTLSERLVQRTRLEDLSDADLARVIRAPADQTSFSSRLEALYERAFRNRPPLMRSNGTADPGLVPTANSGAVVRRIIGDEARTGIRSGLQGRYGEMFATLSNPRANPPIETLRSMRTAIGRELSNFGLYEASLDRTQLRQLYGALSDDIQVGMQDIAARAARQTQARGNNRLSVEDARRASQALRDLQIADRYARQGFERMDRFLETVRAPNPQQAADRLIRSATDGSGGNMRLFRSAMAVLRPEERAEFAALIVRRMGEPTDGARGIIQEVGFSPSRFVTAYQRLSPEARNMMFSQNHQRALDELFRVSNRLSNVEALANTSRSGTNTMNLGGAAAAVGSMAAGDFVTPVAIGGGGLGVAYFMSRPEYTRWLTNYIRLRAEVRRGSRRASDVLGRHIDRLGRMAEGNPALAIAARGLLDDSDE